VSTSGQLMSGMNPIPSSYDYRLVTLSILIAVFASYVALDLAARVAANRGWARFAWLMGGALAMGSGIWAMHFVGMLAYVLPIRVCYHIPTMALSLLIAVLSSMVALHLASGNRIAPLQVALGSVTMGAGIAAVHYTGMSAMRMAAMHRYDHVLWTLSVLLAIVISLAGLQLISRFHGENRGRAKKSLIALVMGLAIPVMHYTGMAAVSFMPVDVDPDMSNSIDMPVLAVITILTATTLIMGVAIIASMVERWISAQYAILHSERSMLRALIDNIPDYMYVKDTKSRFVVANSYLAQTAGVKSFKIADGRAVLEIGSGVYHFVSPR